MTTTTRKGAAVTTTRTHPEPLTLFGRPWQGHEVLVPLLVWIVTAGVPFATVLAGGGTGWLFWLCAAGTVLVLTAVGLGLSATHHTQSLVRLWCTSTPIAAGAWSLLTIGLGVRTGWLYLVWVLLTIVSVVLYLNARRDQFDYEADHFSGAAAAREAEAERVRRALAKRMPTGPDPEPFPALSAVQRERLKFEMLLAKAGAGAGPDRATLVRAGLARPPAPGEQVAHVDPDSRLTVFERIPTAAGFTLWVKLPDDASVSYDTVRGLAGKLEQLFGAKLPEEFPEGSRPGSVRVQRAVSETTGEPITTEVYINVDVRDVLAKTIRMPDGRADIEPISIYEAFPIGEFVDGEPIMLTLAEIHALIVGRTRMGKSNLLNLLTRQVARCYDALLWGYDGKGGRWVRPWLIPWRDGVTDPHTGAKLDRPIFDWAAITLTEFERMVDAGIALAVGRPQLPYATGSGWSATRERPWVLILADELSEASGSNGAGSEFVDTRVAVSAAAMSDKLARLVRLGAGEGVSFVGAQQRGTVTSGMSGDGKAQLGGRILLPVKAGEAAEVLTNADPETIRLTVSLRHPGSTVIEGFGNDESKPGKQWLFGEKDEVEGVARRAVIELTYHRPTLDAGSAALIEKFGYSTRWTDPDRTAWLYHRQPSRPLYRWSAEQKQQTAAAAQGTAPAGTAVLDRPGDADADGKPLARTRAELYGLDKVPNPFAGVTVGDEELPPPPETGGPDDGGPQLGGDDAAAAEWAAREAALLADLEPEMSWRAKVVDAEHRGEVPPPAPAAVVAAQDARVMPADPSMTGDEPPLRTVEPTFENLWPVLVEIVAASGTEGITGAEVRRKLVARNLAPESRGTVNNWLDRLAEGRQLRKPTDGRNARYYTPNHWN
jgi:hypothetical protein